MEYKGIEINTFDELKEVYECEFRKVKNLNLSFITYLIDSHELDSNKWLIRVLKYWQLEKLLQE